MTTRLALAAFLAASALGVAAPAAAQDAAAPPKPFTFSGSAGLVTDYRFRGVSQSDNKAAGQGGITVSHQSGFYGGFWTSNLAGWGQFGGANLELDLIGGFKHTFGSATVDVGLTWYMYPGGADETDFAEPYVKISGTKGPLSLLAGVAYAPKQQALGNYSNTAKSRFGDKEDNLYVWGDAAFGVPNTPVNLKAHIGHSNGNPGLGPNGTSVTPTGEYWDWLVGAEYKIGPVVLGIAYVDTDITKAESAYIQPNFSQVSNGKTIAGAKAVFSVTASF